MEADKSKSAPVDAVLDPLRQAIAEVTKRLADLPSDKMRELIELKWSLHDEINRNCQNEKNRDFEWLVEGWPAQSTCFVMDYMPELQDILLKNYLRSDDIKLLDVGAGTGAGASLIGRLFSTRQLWCRIAVDAIDLFDRRVTFSRNNFRSFNYIIGNIFNIADAQYDIVTCSHVVEHVPELDDFLTRMMRIAKKCVIVYAPYDEKELISGHVNRITEATFAKYSPLSTRVVRSLGWRAGNPAYKCIIAVLPGGRKESVTA